MKINKSFQIYPRKANVFICQLQSPPIFRLQAGYPIRSALGEKLVVVVREGSGKLFVILACVTMRSTLWDFQYAWL